jgi:hypothetical protein
VKEIEHSDPLKELFKWINIIIGQTKENSTIDSIHTNPKILSNLCSEVVRKRHHLSEIPLETLEELLIRLDEFVCSGTTIVLDMSQIPYSPVCFPQIFFFFQFTDHLTLPLSPLSFLSLLLQQEYDTVLAALEACSTSLSIMTSDAVPKSICHEEVSS